MHWQRRNDIFRGWVPCWKQYFIHHWSKLDNIYNQHFLFDQVWLDWCHSGRFEVKSDHNSKFLTWVFYKLDQLSEPSRPLWTMSDQIPGNISSRNSILKFPIFLKKFRKTFLSTRNCWKAFENWALAPKDGLRWPWLFFGICSECLKT